MIMNGRALADGRNPSIVCWFAFIKLNAAQEAATVHCEPNMYGYLMTYSNIMRRGFSEPVKSSGNQ